MICITFDTDYMSQADMKRFINKYPIPGKATFFTHEYFPALDSTVHEICPHPLISDLSEWQHVLEELTSKFMNKPKGVRSHSCVYSHMIGIGLKHLDYKYVSQAQCLFQTGLRPYRDPWGIWELPIFYMDNMDFCMPQNWPDIDHTPFNKDIIKTAIDSESLYVFDIHPLHVALNTNNHKSYCSARKRMIEEGLSPFELRYNGRGAGTFFEELCSSIESSGQQSYTCMEALEHFSCS